MLMRAPGCAEVPIFLLRLRACALEAAPKSGSDHDFPGDCAPL